MTLAHHLITSAILITKQQQADLEKGLLNMYMFKQVRCVIRPTISNNYCVLQC